MGATGKRYVAEVRAEAKRDKASEDVSSRFGTLWRETLLWFYGAVIVVAAVVAAVICGS